MNCTIEKLCNALHCKRRKTAYWDYKIEGIIKEGGEIE